MLADSHAKEIGHGTGCFDFAGGQRLTLAVAIVVGGYIVNNFSFETLFITMGTVQVIATLYLAPMLRSSP